MTSRRRKVISALCGLARPPRGATSRVAVSADDGSPLGLALCLGLAAISGYSPEGSELAEDAQDDAGSPRARTRPSQGGEAPPSAQKAVPAATRTLDQTSRSAATSTAERRSSASHRRYRNGKWRKTPPSRHSASAERQHDGPKHDFGDPESRTQRNGAAFGNCKVCIHHIDHAFRTCRARFGCVRSRFCRLPNGRPFGSQASVASSPSSPALSLALPRGERMKDCRTRRFWPGKVTLRDPSFFSMQRTSSARPMSSAEKARAVACSAACHSRSASSCLTHSSSSALTGSGPTTGLPAGDERRTQYGHRYP